MPVMYKSLISTVKDLDQKGRVVVAANAFGNVDAQNDVSMHGSFSKTIKENFARVKWFLNHDTKLLVGVPIEATETNDFLQVVGQLNLNKDIGRNTYEDYRLYNEYGKSLEHSIGVDAIKYVEDKESGIRKVTEWKWWEYSTLTSWGANERTPMLEMKAAGHVDFLELQLRKGKYTDERFIEIEKSLNILKSLVAEPDNSTQNAKPIPVSEFANISKSILNSLTI